MTPRHMFVPTGLRHRAYEDAPLPVGDGTIGWSAYAPYDAILVGAGSPTIPQPLLDQLAEGGRLLIPIGNMDAQKLVLAERKGGKIEMRDEAAVRFVPLIGHHG